MSDTAPASSLHPFKFPVAEAEVGMVVPARRAPLLVVVCALKVVQFEIWAAYLFHCFVLAAKNAKTAKEVLFTLHYFSSLSYKVIVYCSFSDLNFRKRGHQLFAEAIKV